MIQNKTLVIVCPLNWGLGHASRCIPIINNYLNSGCEVMICASGGSERLLKFNFPQLKYLKTDTFNIRYSKNPRFLFLSLIIQLPLFIIYYIKERILINQLIIKYRPGIIVSDNRYGLFHKDVHSIIITHQISPVLPYLLHWAEYPLYRFLRYFINKFDVCWIPDYADKQNNLSGKLSHRFTLPKNSRYIGILSRFTSTPNIVNNTLFKYDIVIILSGPQPQLSIITELLIKKFNNTLFKTLIVSGFQSDIASTSRNITFKEHVNNDHLKHYILNAGLVICRSGYSSIMDLVALKKTAIIIPTHGQTEQEYLGAYLSEKGLFKSIAQNKIETIDFQIKDNDFSFDKIL